MDEMWKGYADSGWIHFYKELGLGMTAVME